MNADILTTLLGLDPSENYDLHLNKLWRAANVEELSNPLKTAEKVKGWKGVEDVYINAWKDKTKGVRDWKNASEQNAKYAASGDLEIDPSNPKLNQNINDAKKFSAMVLEGDGKGNLLIQELRKAAKSLSYNPTPEAMGDFLKAQRSLTEIFSNSDFLKSELNKLVPENIIERLTYLRSQKIPDPEIFQTILSDSSNQRLLRSKAKDSLRLISNAAESMKFGEEAIRSMNQGFRVEIKSTQLKSMVIDDGASTQGVWSSVRSLLRRVPKVGERLSNFMKVPDSEATKAAKLAVTKHSFEAGEELLQGSKGLAANFMKGIPLVGDYLAEASKDIVRGGGFGIAGNLTKKAFSIAAPAFVAMGLAKAPGMFGQATRTFLDWTYAPGAGDAAAKGDMGAMAGFAAGNAALTGATALVSTTGLTAALGSAITAGLAALSITTAPIVGSILAGAAVFAGVSGTVAGVQHMASHTWGGNTNSNSNIASNPQQGLTGAPGADPYAALSDSSKATLKEIQNQISSLPV